MPLTNRNPGGHPGVTPGSPRDHPRVTPWAPRGHPGGTHATPLEFLRCVLLTVPLDRHNDVVDRDVQRAICHLPRITKADKCPIWTLVSVAFTHQFCIEPKLRRTRMTAATAGIVGPGPTRLPIAVVCLCVCVCDWSSDCCLLSCLCICVFVCLIVGVLVRLLACLLACLVTVQLSTQGRRRSK